MPRSTKQNRRFIPPSLHQETRAGLRSRSVTGSWLQRSGKCSSGWFPSTSSIQTFPRTVLKIGLYLLDCMEAIKRCASVRSFCWVSAVSVCFVLWASRLRSGMPMRATPPSSHWSAFVNWSRRDQRTRTLARSSARARCLPPIHQYRPVMTYFPITSWTGTLPAIGNSWASREKTSSASEIPPKPRGKAST